MKKTLFYNGIIHTMVTSEDTASCMIIESGRITDIGNEALLSIPVQEKIDLNGKHVYPCLIDGHTHMLLTIAVMAMGFNACNITSSGVEPHTVEGVGERIRKYAQAQKKDTVIAINNYILTAVDERRMPTKDELDDWGEGRPVVIYNIDGHSTSLSTAMLKLVGISPDGHSGILQGEENERTQGRIIDAVGSSISLPVLARGIANFQNACADFGITIVGALEGNGDSRKDITTKLIIQLARHFDIGVRLYLQYTDYERVRPYARYMRHLRVGGCGDWEMDGATGSHSAAFRVPFLDTGKTAPCYFTQEETNALVTGFAEKGYQIASHAIGESAITRLIHALNNTDHKILHRIEHCEFHDDVAFEELKKNQYAVMMQPGYAWIDKRYLHTYEQYLPKEICNRLKFRSLYEAGVCVCGSSDSPVQDLNPYLQMLGMTQFYNEDESISPYEAMCTYTKNAARAILEEQDYGTLEVGKRADFFTADRNFFSLQPEQVVEFRPLATYYGGKKYEKKTGSVGELLRMMMTRPKMI